MFSGCNGSQEIQGDFMTFRNSLSQKDQCTYICVVTANYEDYQSTFMLDCSADTEGSVSFAVRYPYSISGITGQINAEGGDIHFDDQILTFPLLADGLISPVSAPWIFFDSLKNGYVLTVGEYDEETYVTLENTFKEYTYRIEIVMNSDKIPVSAIVYWKDRDFMQIKIEQFRMA